MGSFKSTLLEINIHHHPSSRQVRTVRFNWPRTPGLAEVLITLVIMCSFLDSFQLEEKWEVIDMFAGEARISRMGRQIGMPSVGLDLGYHHNPRAFDLNSEPGFLPLDKT